MPLNKDGIPEEYVNEIVKEMIKKKKYVEAGFQSLLMAAYGHHKNIPQRQIEDMRSLFFGGAAHVFSIIDLLDQSTDECTVEDEQKLSNINDELQSYIRDYQRKFNINRTSGPKYEGDTEH